jgi:hypothetical protein
MAAKTRTNVNLQAEPCLASAKIAGCLPSPLQPLREAKLLLRETRLVLRDVMGGRDLHVCRRLRFLLFLKSALQKQTQGEKEKARKFMEKGENQPSASKRVKKSKSTNMKTKM